MRIAKGIWLFSLAALLAIGLAIVWLMTISYEEVIQFTIDQLQRPDLKAVLEENYFTLSKFESLQRASISILFILFGLGGFLIIQRKNFLTFVTDVLSTLKKGFRSVIQTIKNSDQSIKILLAVVLVLVLARSLYYAYTMYPQYDECWNYNYFLSNNFFTTFFAYNNYPLHNVITYAFLSVLPDNTFCMRLPNILIGLLSITLVFVLIKKIFRSDRLALAAAAIFAVLPTVFFYLLFARGVMLALLFAVLLSFYFFVKKINNWTKADLALVILFCGLGCYSMISFPIFVACLFGISLLDALFNKNYISARKIIVAGLGGAVLTLLFYTPILLGSGVHIALDSGYLAGRRTLNTLLQNTQYLSLDQIGFQYGAYVFLLINILLLFKSRHKKILLFNIALLLIPYLLFLLFDTYLPARALGFQAVAYLFTICFLLYYVRENTMLLSATSLIIVAVFSYISSQHTFFSWSERKDKGAYEMAQALQEKNCNRLYDRFGNFSYFVPSIVYHYKLNNREITFFTKNKKSARHLPLENYKGKIFAADFAFLTEQPKKELFYLYKDETNQFVLYELLEDNKSKE